MDNEVIANRTQIVEMVNQLGAQGHPSVALVTIHLAYKRTGKHAQTQLLHAESSAHILQHLRSLVRKTDRVFLQEHSLYFILLGANLQNASIVEERLWEALLWRTHTMSEQRLTRPFSMTIGHAAFPEPQASAHALLQAADAVSKHFEEQPTCVPTSSLNKAANGAHAEPAELPQLAKQLGIPYLSLLPCQVSPRLQQVIGAKLAHELHCYPVGRARNTLTVAMRDPQDMHALERLRQETGLRIFPVLAHPEALEKALQQLVW